MRAVLRVPLFYKILLANAVIVVLGAVVGTAITRDYFRSGGAGFSPPALVTMLALVGVAVTVLVNALILRVALSPLKLLEDTAARAQAGDLDVRVPSSPVADRELERLSLTFNGMLDSLEAYRQRLREIAARALAAEEEERKRIARELHDDTAQSLAALMLRLRVIRGQQDPQARARMLDELREGLGQALERIRRFARGLRPPSLDELGLVPALEAHVRGLSEAAGIPLRVEADPVEGLLSADAELNRILIVGAQNPGALSRSERIRFSWALYELFGTAEFMYHQSREKSLPKVVWARWEATIGWWLSHPGVRAWWKAKASPLAADFQAFGDDLIENDRFDRAADERWKRFVAGESLESMPAKSRQ